MTHRRKDGSDINVICRWVLRPADGDRPAAILVASADITDRKRMEAALKDADRQKDAFLAMLAHELRNPLAPILNATQVLRLRGGPDPLLVQQREVIDRQVGQMKRLLDDLLDAARITRGAIQAAQGPDRPAGRPRHRRRGRPPAGGRQAARPAGDPAGRAARPGRGRHPAHPGVLQPAQQRGQVHRPGRDSHPDGPAGGRRGRGPGGRHRGRHVAGHARAGVRPVRPGRPVGGPDPGRPGDRADPGPPAGRPCTTGR